MAIFEVRNLEALSIVDYNDDTMDNGVNHYNAFAIARPNSCFRVGMVKNADQDNRT